MRFLERLLLRSSEAAAVIENGLFHVYRKYMHVVRDIAFIMFTGSATIDKYNCWLDIKDAVTKQVY